jgi:hypothetical protein
MGAHGRVLNARIEATLAGGDRTLKGILYLILVI